MVMPLNATNRGAIAIQLAEMRSLQQLLISNDQCLINLVNDDHIRRRLLKMLEDDQKNLGILETVIIQSGIQSQPKRSIQQQLEEIQTQMQDSKLSVFEKVFQHELLKHRQTMTGLTIHKAAQLVGADVEAAIAPIHTVNFENRAHQEQLKGILEILGVRELTGQEPDQGLWARVEDAIAALTGVAGSVITRTDDEMSIRDLLLMDHTKSDILFAEILATDDPEKIQECFVQLYKDVSIHGLAEEQIVYHAASPYYRAMPDIVEQTDEAIGMLDEVRSLDVRDPDFKSKVKQVRQAVRDHINQEEKDIFPILKHNFSPEQQKQMATDFKAAKSKLQAHEQLPHLLQQTSDRNHNHQWEEGSINNAMNNAMAWKRMFQVKAVINWIEAIVFLFADGWIRTALNTESLMNPEYNQLFYGFVIVIGIGYWWVGRDISQNHDIVRLGIIGQSSVFAILAYHTLLGKLHPFYLLSGVIDLTFAILFIVFLSTYRDRNKTAQLKGNEFDREGSLRY
ncbi:hemerythrin domain-containing protein [Cyanobacteria bacterium FACHB-DQ100]|nr:hemerythrin domain-containing protein [Cyanobacteria bacterium FACHB-DQ100]